MMAAQAAGTNVLADRIVQSQSAVIHSWGVARIQLSHIPTSCAAGWPATCRERAPCERETVSDAAVDLLMPPVCASG